MVMNKEFISINSSFVTAYTPFHLLLAQYLNTPNTSYAKEGKISIPFELPSGTILATSSQNTGLFHLSIYLRH